MAPGQDRHGDTDPRQELARLRRRFAKLRRKAWADGLLDGVAIGLRPGDVVLDCGANMGDVTARLVDSGATIHAFEPDPDCFAHLSRRFAGQANVVLHNAAVGVRPDRLALYRGVSASGSLASASVRNTLLPGARGVDEADCVMVEVLDLPAFIRDLLATTPRIAFAKIDIEGAEIELLTRLHEDGLLDRIGMTVAETHEKKFRHLADDFARLRALIAAHYQPTAVSLDWI